MSEVAIVWVQTIIGFGVFMGVVIGLQKVVKDEFLRAAIVAGLVLIWLDSGGINKMIESGFSQWARDFIIGVMWYGSIFFLAYCISMKSSNQEK